MAYGDPEAPDDGSNDGSSGGDPVGSQGGGSPSVGPGTGRNENNPAAGQNIGGLLGGTTGSSAVDSAMAGLLGLLGFDPSSPVTGVNVETEEEAPHTHPDEGLFGVQSVSLTDPGYSKAVDNQGKALSANKARQKNLYGAFIDATKNKKTEIDALRAIKNRTRQQNLELSKLERQYRNLLDSDQYSKAMAKNNPALGFGAKALASALGLGVLGFGPTLEGFATEMGFIDDTTPQDVMDRDPLDDASEGPDEGQATFWSLMNVVRNNRDIFENVSIEKIRELLGDSKKFWEFYSTAKAEQTS